MAAVKSKRKDSMIDSSAAVGVGCSSRYFISASRNDVTTFSVLSIKEGKDCAATATTGAATSGK